MGVEALNQWLVALGLSVPRIAAAFLILPLLTQQTVPALVRNAIFITLGLVVLPVTAYSLEQYDLTQLKVGWPVIVLKEIFIGATLGFLFGSIFWALSVAGGIIDTQAGTNMASAMDPVQGHQSSPNARWLALFASWLLVVSGGLLVFIDLIFGSYQLWPVLAPLPNLSLGDSMLFIGEFEYIMTTGLLLAAPAILLLALVDLCFGLINRFAQELNVLALTMPVKAWVAGFILMLSLGMIVEVVIRKLMENKSLLLPLKAIFNS